MGCALCTQKGPTMFKLPEARKQKTVILTRKQLQTINPAWLLDHAFIRRLAK